MGEMSVPGRIRLAVRRGLREEGASWYRVRQRPWVYRGFALGTVPASRLVSNPHLVMLYLRAAPYTLLSFEQFEFLVGACQAVLKSGVSGNVVQCGVWNGGGAAVLVRTFSSELGRRIFLFDSWEGVPAPSEHDVNASGGMGTAGLFKGSESMVRDLLFRQMKSDPARIELIRGWFHETLAQNVSRIGPVAFVHLDCDFYEPVRLCLEALYPALVPGGLILVDDYDDWQGCKKAVDEFMLTGRPSPLLEHKPRGGVLIRKGPPD